MKSLILLVFTFTFLNISPTLNVFAKEDGLGVYPQGGGTKKPKQKFYVAKNLLSKSKKNIKDDKLLFEKTARPLQCLLRTGVIRKDVEDPGFKSTPSAKNLTCKKTMAKSPDGQLFLIIKNGSTRPTLPEFRNLKTKIVGNWRFILEVSQKKGWNLSGT